MKNIRAILFLIVLILGLPFVATGGDFNGYWAPFPSEVDTLVDTLNDWDNTNPGPDASFIKAMDEYDSLTVDFEDPTGGPYTAIKVKFRAKSNFGYSDVVIYVKGDQIDVDGYLTFYGDFADYTYEWTDLNMTAENLANLQVQMMFTYFSDQMDISAIQVELVSEVAAPPEVPDPIPVKIDYLPYKSSNPLNYRSRGKVRVVIFGSADFNVRQIDRESVLLEGVAPVRDHKWKIYSRTGRARDDYEDLVLMFKTQQVIEALEKSLGQELENGEEVFLNLTGNLKDDGATLTGNLKDDGATPIEGQDTAVVFGKHPKHKKKGNWKNYWKRHRREKD
jgi:hypothetical protein